MFKIYWVFQGPVYVFSIEVTYLRGMCPTKEGAVQGFIEPRYSYHMHLSFDTYSRYKDLIAWDYILVIWTYQYNLLS